MRRLMDRLNRFLLTNHASMVLRERDISVEWVRRVLTHPHLRLPDAEDPDLFHALAPIAEREDRVVRVVYKWDNGSVAGCHFLLRPRLEGDAMKLHFDEKADGLYLRLDDAPVTDSQEVSAGIVLDFNNRSQVVGIEAWT